MIEPSAVQSDASLILYVGFEDVKDWKVLLPLPFLMALTGKLAISPVASPMAKTQARLPGLKQGEPNALLRRGSKVKEIGSGGSKILSA
jgi:hypothetical protein